jgi:hypothetical protein
MTINANTREPKDARRFSFSVGRLFVYCTWSINGLWWNNTDIRQRIGHWFFIGTVSKDDVTMLQIILLKARFTFGWMS